MSTLAVGVPVPQQLLDVKDRAVAYIEKTGVHFTKSQVDFLPLMQFPNCPEGKIPALLEEMKGLSIGVRTSVRATGVGTRGCEICTQALGIEFAISGNTTDLAEVQEKLMEFHCRAQPQELPLRLLLLTVAKYRDSADVILARARRMCLPGESFEVPGLVLYEHVNDMWREYRHKEEELRAA